MGERGQGWETLGGEGKYHKRSECAVNATIYEVRKTSLLAI
jgi:hypothetical protein